MIDMQRLKGLSLIEILVGITMASMIFIIASSLVVSTMGYSTKSKRAEILEQTKNDLQVELTNSIKWADKIEVSDNVLTVDGVTYEMVDGVVNRNGKALTASGVVIKSFVVTKYTSSLEVNIEMENKDNPNVKDTMRLYMSPRNIVSLD